ncbi:MAG: fused response regulator/phosphatase [Agarilytica sp.]
MKILIVDDHEYNRELLTFILEDEGYEFSVATNGVEACDAVRNDSGIDMILMDVSMPEMDGIEATSIIKKEQSDHFIPIIFVTALHDTDELAKCLDAGGDDFVPKPINESVLLAKIKAHGRTRELTMSLHEANKKLEYHKQTMDREHAIVERIFDRGAQRIKTECVNVKTYSSPMSMFNGDIVLEAPSPSGGVYILVGDFTGHGLAASIGTLPVTEIFYRLSKEQASIGLIAKEINRSLVDLLPETMFFCAAICYLDNLGKNFSLWAGGMNDLMRLNQKEQKIEKVQSEHMPLGILSEEEFDDTVTLFELEKSEHLFIYTDGVNEASNDSSEEFGLGGIERVLLSGKDNLLEVLIDEVHEFQGEAQNDDITLVEVLSGKLEHKNKENGEVVDIQESFHVADSFPWKFTMRLEGEELRNSRIVDQIMDFVSRIHGIELHREKIFTLVSELYSNALEHGVLGLKSELKESADGFEEYYRLRGERLENIQGHFIDLDFTFNKNEPNNVELTITDSGKGFDYRNMMKKLEENADPFGRGIPLLKHLCSELDYTNEGKTVRVVYQLALSEETF